LGAAALLGVAGMTFAATGDQELATWRIRMEKVSATMSSLMPDLVSAKRFGNPKNRNRLLGQIRTLREAAHDMSTDKSTATRDPSVGMMTSMLRQELVEAEWALRDGHAQYAQAVLFNVVNTCVGCHSRTDVGAQFGPMKLTPEETQLSVFERASLHAATRRYDDAFKEYADVISDVKAPVERGLDWDRSVQAALTLSVRAMDNPQRARQVADLVVANPTAPLFLKQTAMAWRESIDAWVAQPVPATPPSDDELQAQANTLLEKALVGSRYHSKRGNAVLYLRASRLLHDLLGRSPDSPRAQEALYLLGIAYEGLNELELFTLHPMMFEACIRKEPHTPTAALCLERYEASVYTQFSGSGGFNLPPEVKKHLTELQKLGQ
jgi:cytochrome c553